MNLAEVRRRCGADLEAGRIGADQMREARLYRCIALDQRIIVGVGNDRRVLLIIGGRMAGDFRRQPFKLDSRFGFRSEEHTSELPSLMRISYAVFCSKKKTEQ